MKYKYLKIGDTIQEGDQANVSEGFGARAKWIDAKQIGLKVFAYKTYRRKS